MRVTHAINNYNIYKLISFFELIFAVFFKSLSDHDYLIVIHSNFLSGMHGCKL